MRRILLFFLVFTFFFADAQKGKGKKKAATKKTAVAKQERLKLFKKNQSNQHNLL